MEIIIRTEVQFLKLCSRWILRLLKVGQWSTRFRISKRLSDCCYEEGDDLLQYFNIWRIMTAPLQPRIKTFQCGVAFIKWKLSCESQHSINGGKISLDCFFVTLLPALKKDQKADSSTSQWVCLMTMLLLTNTRKFLRGKFGKFSFSNYCTSVLYPRLVAAWPFIWATEGYQGEDKFENDIQVQELFRNWLLIRPITVYNTLAKMLGT